MTPSRIHRLSLTHFRNYRAASVQARGDVVVLVGPNGAGKTNCLEAISFLSPGRGLRRARLEDVAETRATVHGPCRPRSKVPSAWRRLAPVSTRRAMTRRPPPGAAASTVSP